MAVRAARSVLSNRRFDRLVALPAAALLLASVVQAVPAGAAGLPGDPGASDVVVGLIRLGGALGAASQQPALSDHLPLTDESVRDVLQLDTALGRHVTDDVTGANATLDTLPAAFANDPALKLAEATPSAGAPAGSREWILSVSLKGSVPVTLAYQDDRLQFGAAELTGELAGTLTGDIRIRYDASQIPLRRFSVVGESQLTTHVWTRGVNSSATTGQTLTAPSFKAVDGFVQLDAQGTGTVDSSTVLRLRDPNGRGALTTEDLEFSDPQELFTTQILPGADDVHMQFDLSTDLLGSGTHGSVSVGTRAASSQDPYATPAITRDATLDRLTSLTRTQALTGFTQYVTALTGAESAVDAGLPMLDANLTDLYSPGNKLLSLMTQQATAAISCGAADTSPPTGAPRPGEVRYCQATTSGLGVDAGTDITWGSPDPGVTVTGDTAGTIGTAPSANVRVSGGGGFPVLTVSFTNGGQRRTARTVVSSIQQLGSAVHDLGLDGTLTYDTSRQSLEVAVQQHQAAALTTNVATGGNGNLAPLTGLTGLCEAAVGMTPRACPRTGDSPTGGTLPAPATGHAAVTTSDREIDATFGIGLVPPAGPMVEGAPAPATPVTYLKPGPDGLLWKVGSVSADITDDAPMLARIGFLQVDVDVSAYDLHTASGGTAAQITVPTGDVALAGGTVADAVDVTRLLGSTSATGAASPVQVTATRGLSATATLAVKDSPATSDASSRPVNADGTIHATWADLSPNHLPSVTTDAGYDQLRRLDLVPSRQGTMGDGTDGATLVDSSADFETQFGLDSSSTDKSVTRQLYDLDAADNDKTVCTAFTVVDTHTLTCTSGPLASPDSGMAPGHHYVINGDPEALRDVLIDDLAGVLTAYSEPNASVGADRTLPLVDLLPSDISAARLSLSRTLVHLQQDATGDSPETDVSTLQGFEAAIAHYAPTSSTTLSLPAGSSQLILDTDLQSAPKTTFAPLRLTSGDSEVRVIDGVDDNGDPARVTLPLRTSSDARVHLAVDLGDGASYVGKDTTVGEKVDGFASSDSNLKVSLADKSTEYGSTSVRTGAAPDISVGIGLRVDTAPSSSSPTWIPIGDFRDSLTQVRAVDGAAQTCGGASGSDVAACATLPLVGADAPHSALTTLQVALSADQSSGGTGADLAHQPLAFRFLTDGLSAFSRTLGDSLDGNAAGLSLPMVGTDLDAGADVPAAVTAYTAAARTALTAVTDDETTPAATFATDLTDALNGVRVANVDHTDTTVTVLCDGDPCGSDDTVAEVTEVKAPLELSGDQPNQTATFRAGLAGIALDTNLKVPTTTAWTLDVTVGIQRGSGPFLVMKPASGSSVDVLTEHVTAKLPTYSSTNCHAWDRAAAWETKRNTDAGSSNPANTWVKPSKDATARCIDAFVGKLPSVLVDRQDTTPGGNHTGLDADLTVAITPGDAADSDGRVYLPAIFDKKLSFATTATGDGGISVYFESYASDLGFFDVMGTMDLDWHDGVFADAGLQYGNLDIDAKTVYDVLDTGYAKAKKWLAPLNPAVDVLSAPIPGVSDMAELVGSPPISMLSILAKAHAGLALVTNLLEFQQLVARLPGSGSQPELVGLGSGVGGAFHMSSHSLQFNSCTSTATRDGGEVVITGKSSGTGAAGRCDEGALSRIKRKINGKAPEDPTAGEQIQKKMTKSAYFSLPSISVPVLQDATQIYDILLDSGDATMLYVDLGHMGAKVSLVRNFGPLMIGPVPVVASVGGTVGIDGRMAFGFDTRGLTNQIASVDEGDVHALHPLSRGQVFSDGFFIDDLEKGVDVPEIQLTATFQVGASVSIGFAEAGIQGGATLDLSLDAFDPNHDGKIYTDEFAGSDNGPDCAFNVSSGLTFFLQFYFHIDLLITSIDKTYDIVRSPRIKLFEFNCAPADPTLAVVENGDLWLTMGSHVSQRHAFSSVTDEKYTVRQVGATASDGTTKVEVSAFNLVQDYTVPAGGRIRAEGLGGDDTVKLYPGQVLGHDDTGATTVTDVPFTVPALVLGGDGNDTVATGDGADEVHGGAGTDSITTGAGNDQITGDDDSDVIDSGTGHDVVDGGAGDDRISGGPSTDSVTGGPGDDTIDGGIGVQPTSLFPTTDADVIGRMLDSGDLLVGGDGSDDVTGGDGSDLAVGGSYDASGVTFTGDQTTRVFGVTPTGHLTAVDVTIKTVTLPTLAAVRAECALPGDAGTGQDQVSGGGDRDYVIGGGGSDQLSGGAAADVVCGRGGDDVLDGDGSDVVPSDQGADEVRGGPGRDRLYGSGGDDNLYGDADNDLARGGDGADTISGGSGSDLLAGESGVDTISGDDAGTGSSATADTARNIVCATSTSVVDGLVDLNGDLSGNGLDDGSLEGLRVTDGQVIGTDGSAYTGMLGGVVFTGGKADLDGNGRIESRTADLTGDTGVVDLAGMTGAVGDGDCILGGDAADGRLDGQQGGDYVDAGTGNDAEVHGGPGDDLVRGGDGQDTVQGEAGDDLVAGDAGDDVLYGEAGNDTVRGSSGQDLIAGGSDSAGATDGADQLLGDGGNDVVAGGNASLSRTALAGTAIPGVGITLLATPADSGPDDQAFGGYGNDWVFGQSGADQAFGGPDDDVVEGGEGDDTVQGDDGNDLLVGGSSTGGAVTLTRSGAGIPDGNDTINGDHGVDGLDGSDVMAGDNARLDPPPATGGTARTRWARIRPGVGLQLFDVATTTAPAAGTSGDDTLSGDGADDLILGQAGNDTVSGGDGNDAVEGQAGADAIHGDNGDDELLGGSWTAGANDAAVGGTGDSVFGDTGDDVVLGDNGTVVTGATPRVQLLDVPNVGAAAAAPTYGGDALSGGVGNDTVFGQGGNDTLHGDDGLDALEGDAGADTLFGDAGDDALTGGSSAGNGAIIATRTATGQLDGADTLSGGLGDDVLAGDNARMDRQVGLRADGTTKRTVTLFDLDRATAPAAQGAGAADVLAGDDGRDLIFGQAGNDQVTGGTGDDYVEGNAGDDTIDGGLGEDDLVGGGSSNTGDIITAATDRLLTAPSSTVDASAAGLVDGNDTITGGDSTDVALGDNGRITRNGPNATIAGGGSGVHVVRQVAMADAGPGVWAGSDQISGQAGDDDLYGGFDSTGTTRTKQSYAGQPVPGDVLDGGNGDDALLGDQGVDVPTPAGSLGTVNTTVSNNGGFVSELIRPAGTLVRVVTQTQPTVGGDDLLLGGTGFDSIHAGAGADLVNAGDGADVVFGGDGADAIWGGADHDRIFGGTGDDFLDLKKRVGDSALWGLVAPSFDTDNKASTTNGLDVIYGGSGHDALQADMGDQGKTVGDRLIDWNGVYNLYQVCNGAYGAGKVQNKADPSTVSLLTDLAAATGSVGPAELALVSSGDETNPKYPGAPGNFTCEAN